MRVTGRTIRAFFAVALALTSGTSALLFPANAAEAPSSLAPPNGPAEQPPTSELTLDFVGDIMAHPINYSTPPYSAIYEAVAPELRSADLAFANLEFTIDPMLPYAGWPRFNVHPDYVRAAIDAGINVFSNANNHIADYGVTGTESTRGVMQAFSYLDGVYSSGLRAAPGEAFQPTTIERKGWRIGFLAITEFLNADRRSEFVNVVDYRNAEERDAFLAFLRAETPKYDLFVLSVHGGIEYDLQPEPAKVAFFDEALRAGVGIVWSQHPHVLEPWRLVDVGGSRRLIIYSNGNFISGQTAEIDPRHPDAARAYTGDSAIFRVRVARAEGVAGVASVDPILISNYKDAEGRMVVRPLAELAGADLPAPWGDYYRYRFRVMSAAAAPAVAAAMR